MLLGQHCGRHQQAHLHPVVHGLEGRPQRHLGLAVAHVAADKPVHGPGEFHVGLDVVNGLGLVRRLDVGEGVFQFLLPDRIGAELMPPGNLAGGVGADEFLRHLPRRSLHLLLDARPVGGPQAGQGGRVFLGAHVGADPVQVVCGDVQLVALRVFQNEVLSLVAVLSHLRGSGEAGDAVVNMHD